MNCFACQTALGVVAHRPLFRLVLPYFGLFRLYRARVLEVTNRTRLQDVDFADRQYFIEDQASLIRYEPQDLSINDQREEFYVRWTPRTISLVKFEYRQVAKPGEVFEETYGSARRCSKAF